MIEELPGLGELEWGWEERLGREKLGELEICRR
jgi:hypothetical protein